MAFTFGFYNSLNHDRVYDAVQMSQMFDGVVTDGVFQTVGDVFYVTAGTGMTVVVGTGRAWFDHTWNYLDASESVSLPSAGTNSRYDAIVLEINSETRTNSLTVVSGSSFRPPENGTYPELTNTSTLHQYALAYVLVPGGATSVSQSNIIQNVGTSSCPYAEVATGNSVELAKEEIYAQVRTWLGDGTVSKLGTTTIGGNTKPIYWYNGKPIAITSTVGSGTKPVYLSSGVITPFSATVGGETQPLYLKSGALTAGNEYVPKKGGTFTGTLQVVNSTSTGNSVLFLGNAANTGYGYIRFFDTKANGYYANLRTASTLSANRTYTLPDKTGTIAMTDDVSTRELSYEGTNTSISATSTAKRINATGSLSKGTYLFIAHQFIPGTTSAKDCRLILRKLKTGGFDKIAEVRSDTYATGTSSGYTAHLIHIETVTAATIFELWFSSAYSHTTNVDPSISYMQVYKLS